jgi:hypothetical protein
MDFLAFIGKLAIATAFVSFAMAAFVRSTALCVVGSAVITFLGMELLILSAAPSSPHPEEIMLGFNMVAMVGTPVFLISAGCFVLLAKRVYRSRGVGCLETKG